MEEGMEERMGDEMTELYVTCLHSGSWILSGFCRLRRRRSY